MMSSRWVKVFLNKILIDEKRREQIIVLKEEDGNRQFPIMIGPMEASSIKMELAGVEPPRPLTHDLLAEVIEAFGGECERLVIDGVVEGTFHAKLYLTDKDGHEVIVDSRPSDGVALAVRMDSEIFVEEEILASACLPED